MRTTSLACFFAIIAATSSTFAENRELKLLNPDGTPATDAKVLAVITPGFGTRIDRDGKPMPRQLMNGDRQPVPLIESKNDGGTIGFEKSAKALFASSDKGVAFVPSSAYDATVKLRAWGELEVDATNLSDELRSRYVLHVSWSNCLAGIYDRPTMGHPQLKAAVIDWRLHPYISIDIIANWDEEVIRVPPGEVAIRLIEKGQADRIADNNVKVMSTTIGVGVGRITSGETTVLTVPHFGSAVGVIALPSSGLPDWNRRQSEDQPLVRAAMPTNWKIAVPRDWTKPEIDKYVRALSTKEAMKERGKLLGNTAKIDAEGRFNFPALVPGSYSFLKLTRVTITSANPNSKALASEPPRSSLKAEALFSKSNTETRLRSGGAPGPSYVVRSGEVTDLGEVVVVQPSSYSTPTTAQRAVELFWQGKHQAGRNAQPAKYPYYTTPKSPRDYPYPTVQQPLAAPSGITEKPAQMPRSAPSKDDTAIALIDRWLRDAGDDADKAELKKVLREHLEGEFDATQKARRFEIERLQKLLERSKQYLEERESRRNAIVEKRIDELMSKPTTTKRNTIATPTSKF